MFRAIPYAVGDLRCFNPAGPMDAEEHYLIPPLDRVDLVKRVRDVIMPLLAGSTEWDWRATDSEDLRDLGLVALIGPQWAVGIRPKRKSSRATLPARCSRVLRTWLSRTGS